jgi:hypothetical protein
VVGLDGSAHALDALRFAIEESRYRNCPLLVVEVWQLPDIAEVRALLRPRLAYGGGVSTRTCWTSRHDSAPGTTSSTNRTARSRSSSGYFLGAGMAPLSL